MTKPTPKKVGSPAKSKKLRLESPVKKRINKSQKEARSSSSRSQLHDDEEEDASKSEDEEEDTDDNFWDEIGKSTIVTVIRQPSTRGGFGDINRSRKNYNEEMRVFHESNNNYFRWDVDKKMKDIVGGLFCFVFNKRTVIIRKIMEEGPTPEDGLTPADYPPNWGDGKNRKVLYLTKELRQMPIKNWLESCGYVATYSVQGTYQMRPTPHKKIKEGMNDFTPYIPPTVECSNCCCSRLCSHPDFEQFCDCGENTEYCTLCKQGWAEGRRESTYLPCAVPCWDCLDYSCDRCTNKCGGDCDHDCCEGCTKECFICHESFCDGCIDHGDHGNWCNPCRVSEEEISKFEEANA